jgi:hypothetical protein
VTLNLRGLGDTAATVPSACGDNPCGLWDDIYVSDACAAYLACAGLPPMTFSAQLSAGVQSITQGAASVVGSAVAGTASGITGGLGIGGTVLLGVGALMALVAVTEVAKRG